MLNNSKNLQFINYAYAIGAIFVVLGHSTPTGISDMPLWIDAVRTFIYDFHMPLFFFIAGFLFKYTSSLRKKKYGTFIKEKCVRFLTPYFVLTFVGLIPKILVSNFVNDDVEFSADYITKAIFSPRDNVWGHFWFLPTLLIIYVFSYLILKASRNNLIFLIVMLGAFIFAVFPTSINWFALNDICDQLIYFCIGVLAEKAFFTKRKEFLQPRFAILNSALAIFIFVYLRYVNYYGCYWLLNLSNVIIGILMIYSIFYISVDLEGKCSKILDYFEGKTFSIYIISWPCQAITEIIVNRVFHIHWYFVMPSMFIAGLGVPLLVNEIYKRLKWHPKFINLVFGFNIKKGEEK